MATMEKELNIKGKLANGGEVTLYTCYEYGEFYVRALGDTHAVAGYNVRVPVMFLLTASIFTNLAEIQLELRGRFPKGRA